MGPQPCRYPLIAKRCFSLLHCRDCDTTEQCDAGSAMLMRGPTVVRRTWDDVSGNPIRAELKMPCWQALVICHKCIVYTHGHNYIGIAYPMRAELKMSCWQGEHKLLGALASLVLCAVVVGYPAVTYWRMRCSAAFSHHGCQVRRPTKKGTSFRAPGI